LQYNWYKIKLYGVDNAQYFIDENYFNTFHE